MLSLMRSPLLDATPLDALFRHHHPAFAAAPALLVPAAHSAHTDLSETENGYVVTLATPGVPTSELALSCDDGVLHLAAESRSGGRLARFERQVRLPTNADAEAATASHENGLIHVTVPKKQRLGPFKLELGSAPDQPDDGSRYRLTLEVAGIAPQDLSVTVQEGEVKLEGSSAPHGIRYAVNRRFHLPRDAEAAAATASLVDGILTISVPKRERPPAKQLTIEAAGAVAPAAQHQQDQEAEPAQAMSEEWQEL